MVGFIDGPRLAKYLSRHPKMLRIMVLRGELPPADINPGQVGQLWWIVGLADRLGKDIKQRAKMREQMETCMTPTPPARKRRRCKSGAVS